MQYKRNYKLIDSKFWQYYFPTLFSIFAGNMAIFIDSLIVSSLIGVEALSGMQIMFPLSCFVNLWYWMLGLGGSLLCATAKANFDEKEANTIFSVSIRFVVFVGVLFTILGFLFSNVLIGYLSNPIHPNSYALEYFNMYIFGIPFLCFLMSMYHFVRADGFAKFGFHALLIASILNPVFDVILIKYFNLGMTGSGLATTISYIGGSIYMSMYFFKSTRTLRIIRVKLSLAIKYFLSIIKLGFASASTQLYITLSMLVYNYFIMAFIGDEGLFSFQICINTFFLISIFLLGLAQTVSPLLSVFYPDGDYSAVDHLKNLSFKLTIVVGVAFAGILMFFPQPILMLYSVDIQYYQIVTNALKFYGLGYLPIGFVILYIFYAQSIQKNKLANFISLFYYLIFVVVFLFILTLIIGENGIWLTNFCTGMATLIALVVYSKYLNKKTEGEYHGIYINKSHDANFWEFTINANSDEVKGLVSLIGNKLENNKFSDSVCTSLEEFLSYVIETNDNLETIDVIIDVCEDSIKIHVKDLSSERNEDFTFKSQVDFNRTMDYSWVIGLNSTLITIN